MIRKNISLKKYNSFNIEIDAKEFAEVNSIDELIEISNITKGKKVLYLGGGSNILFTKNFDGVVIHLNLKGIKCEKINSDETVESLKEFSFVIRKTLSKKINMKFLPKLLFVKDESFDYAEKIENLIKQTNK